LTLGLSFTNHYTIVLVIIPLFLFIFSKIRTWDKKQFSTALVFFFLGLLPIVYLPIAARFHPPINYEDPENLHNLFFLLSRRMYNFTAARSIIPVTLEDTLSRYSLYFRSISANFHIFLIFLIPFYWFMKKDRKLTLFLLSAFIASGPFFIYLYNFRVENILNQAIFERFFMMSFIIIIVMVGVGLGYFLETISKYKIFSNICIILCFIPLSTSFLFNLHAFNISQSDIYLRFGHYILDTLPKNSIFITTGERRKKKA
jgi:hypothetical protein